jgi:Mrp family chromosome partitioning ATPase
MANLLEQLTSQHDVVLIDTPPLLPVTDAAILAKITGGAVVVAAADRIHRQQLADGLGSLEDVGARVLGVVLNRLAHKQNDGYSYYDYAYAPAQATGAKGRRKHSRSASSDPAQTRTTHSSTRRVSSEADPNETARIDQEPVRVASLPHDDL